jgi:hypothetical protein
MISAGTILRRQVRRMFHHFVGHVYVFHDPPQEELPLVDIPILTQPDNAPESLLMQIDEVDLSTEARSRIRDILNQRVLPVGVIRASKGIDPRAQIRLAADIRERSRELYPLLNWTRLPSYDQLVAACELLWTYFVNSSQRRAGISSGKQLAYRIDNFRKLGGVGALMKNQLNRAREDSPDDTVEDTIEFLRYWANVNFPRMLMTLDRIQRHVFEQLGRKAGNYMFYASTIENWLLDPAIMALDEYGIPVQVGEKLQSRLNPDGDLDLALKRLREITRFPDLSAFELALIRDAKDHF